MSIKELARAMWNADRELLAPGGWPMPAWSRTPAWRKRPYLLAAQDGKRHC